MRARSFTDFLDRYGQSRPPDLCHREGEDIRDWQARFRAKLEQLRGDVPERVVPRVEVVETVEEADHTRHLLDIRVTAMSTLPAYLLIPRGLKPDEKRAGLLASHGHLPYGIDSVCGLRGMEEGDHARRAYALEAVRGGFVVLAPAWWGWAGRDGHLPLVGQRDRCNVIQTMASMYGFNVLDLHIQDGQAALDVLAARPEVDPARLGCLGNSYGGRTTMWLTIFDERIKACVSAGCMNRFRERSLKLRSCGIQYLHGLLRHGDVDELFSLIAPRPMQLQAGKLDPLITPADRDAMEQTIRRAYNLLGAEDRFDYVLHEEGHLLLWPPARDFLARFLAPGGGA